MVAIRRNILRAEHSVTRPADQSDQHSRITITGPGQTIIARPPPPPLLGHKLEGQSDPEWPALIVL